MKLQGPRSELAFGVQGYPDAFCTLAQPPSCLYVVGEIDALREGLAVVGARNATPYGRFAAKLFSTAAARRGIPIISGGARGCDAAAHRAAIEAGGVTVAFLGGGCDELYPKENAGLFQDIVNAGGAGVSEQPWGMPPRPYMFRMRNRLIAGLARATLIVEAGLPSGTFSTADEALAANREVLVVPGSIMFCWRALYPSLMRRASKASYRLFSLFLPRWVSSWSCRRAGIPPRAARRA
mgnify:CR=1 FL=1